jgi:hypothetical protein
MSIAGSPYGEGFYGKGPYGFATRIFGVGAASKVVVRGQQVSQGIVNVVSASRVGFAGQQLWALIAVPPCQPWPQISVCTGCAQAVPNKAGNMFPGLA